MQCRHDVWSINQLMIHYCMGMLTMCSLSSSFSLLRRSMVDLESYLSFLCGEKLSGNIEKNELNKSYRGWATVINHHNSLITH